MNGYAHADFCDCGADERCVQCGTYAPLNQSHYCQRCEEVFLLQLERIKAEKDQVTVQ